MFARKKIKLGLQKYNVVGLSEDDAYFRVLEDDFEPEFGKIIERVVHSDYVCMDIGANIGIKSLQLAQCGSNRQSDSYRALPHRFSLLV
jgi:hypothetical protein